MHKIVDQSSALARSAGFEPPSKLKRLCPLILAAVLSLCRKCLPANTIRTHEDPNPSGPLWTVADNALDRAARALDYTQLPAVTFTSPALASAGMIEAAALEAGLVCECRVLPLSAVPRALVNRDTRSAIKLVAEAGSGRLLGAHVLAEGAGDVIATAVYALANHMTVAQMASLWCPYLTMAEGLKLAAQTFTTDVAKLSC